MPNTRIHATAVIHDSAKLGNGVAVGPFAVIEEDVVIGDECSIAAHAVIKRHTRMRRGNQVAEMAVIGGEPQDTKFKPCVSYVEIGDANMIREAVTIHRGSSQGAVTSVGDRNFLMASCHIGHDCRVGDDVVIANASLLAGFVTVFDRAFISGAVAVHQFCRVGRLSMIGGGSKITQDALPFVITDGAPGRARGINLVGLKRARIANSEIECLKRAFRTMREGKDRQRLIAELRALPALTARELADFIESSQRGFASCQ